MSIENNAPKIVLDSDIVIVVIDKFSYQTSYVVFN